MNEGTITHILTAHVDAASIRVREAVQSCHDLADSGIVGQGRIRVARLNADAWGLQHI